jgi:hypothetical protein
VPHAFLKLWRTSSFLLTSAAKRTMSRSASKYDVVVRSLSRVKQLVKSAVFLFHVVLSARATLMEVFQSIESMLDCLEFNFYGTANRYYQVYWEHITMGSSTRGTRLLKCKTRLFRLFLFVKTPNNRTPRNRIVVVVIAARRLREISTISPSDEIE